MAEVTLKNVKKQYDNGFVAVHDFNLDIKHEEFIVLVGPSGCGKSTTLRMIAGLEDITGGEIAIDGTVVNDMEPKDRDIAMVFQNYALYPHMSVYENIAFGLRLRKMPNKEIHKKVTEAAEILGITELLGRKPKQLSGGQRQRVAIGRAIVRVPKVFLMDEPLSNLDAKLRNQMRAEIILLREKIKTTFVYVTHDQTEAMTMGDRICVMKDGIIQQFDTPQNLYNSPCNMFVDGFIGSPQMNFIKARVKKDPAGFAAVFGSTRVPVKGQTIASYEGKEIMLGVRPEDLHIEPEIVENAGKSVFRTEVTLDEMMGSEIYLYFNLDREKMIARIPSKYNAKMGDHVKLAIDPDTIHIFDPETEKAIV